MTETAHSNPKLSFLLLIATLALLSRPALSSKRLVETKPVTSTQCNYELITSFGFRGLVNPSTYQMPSCPDIKRSCCRVSDQLVMIDNWEINYERIELEERLDSNRAIYEEVLTVAQDVEVRAEYMMSRLKNRMFSNCRVLATKVAEYKIKKVADKLREDFEAMDAFVANSYKGLYCAMCDADQQANFRVAEGKVNLSRKFCRQMTAKFFPFLLYFHVHMIKYMNLLMRFLTYCDGKGKFSNVAIDPDLLMKIDRKFKGVLEGCRDYRNRPEWFEKCQPICMDWNMLRFPALLLPQREKYQRTTQVIQELLRKFELPPEPEENLEEDGPVEGTFRMTPHKKSFDKSKLDKSVAMIKSISGGRGGAAGAANKDGPGAGKKTKFGSDFVIKSQAIVSLNIETFSNEFKSGRRGGMNLYEIGRQAQMSLDNLPVIQQLVANEVVNNWDGGFDVSYPVIDALMAAKKAAILEEAAKKQSVQKGPDAPVQPRKKRSLQLKAGVAIFGRLAVLALCLAGLF